ncbi:MAG: hypothetical protein FWG20_02725 [Candidatus Cloacimonetes bacterium]|nr:hypothetical protein [Candidatus Cloacimonadota bacterium]
MTNYCVPWTDFLSEHRSETSVRRTPSFPRPDRKGWQACLTGQGVFIRRKQTFFVGKATPCLPPHLCEAHPKFPSNDGGVDTPVDGVVMIDVDDMSAPQNVYDVI